MNANKFEKIKSTKPFNKKDFFVYAILFVVILSLFLTLVLLSQKSPVKGFKVLIGNEIVLEFSFDTSSAKIKDGYQDLIDVDYENNKITVYFNQEKNDFNEISYDITSKSVRMNNSTCSHSKDCVYMPKIIDDKGLIYCAPHELKILPLSEKLSNSPVTG